MEAGGAAVASGGSANAAETAAKIAAEIAYTQTYNRYFYEINGTTDYDTKIKLIDKVITAAKTAAKIAYDKALSAPRG